MQGEAVLGLEAAARALVQPGTPVLNLVSGVFGKGMGYWLKDFGAELHELEVPYNDAVDPADVERYLVRAPRDRARHGRPLRDAVGDAARPLRDRADRARARCADAVDCVSSLGGIELRDRRLAARRLRRSGAEVPRRPSRHLADDRERRRLGADPREPGGAAGLVPVDARLEGAVDRRRQVPVHAVGRRHARHRRRAATSCSRRVSSTSIARHELAARACRAGVRAMGLELWPRSEEITAALRDGDRRARTG